MTSRRTRRLPTSISAIALLAAAATIAPPPVAMAATTPSARACTPEEYAALAELMITNGYFTGESVRLDGAIRMAPR